MRHAVCNIACNTDENTVQQGDNKAMFGNKEQIKTMISIISCNPVVIDHQVHRRASWRSQILEGSGREKKINISSLFIKVYFINMI